MDDLVEGWPVAATFAFFLAGALARSQALYWLGRGAAAGTLRTRWSPRLDAPRIHAATRAVERRGMPAVPLAFLTVGFQSAVFIAVGLLRVGWLRFTIWSVPGALVWAAAWGGTGLAVAATLWALARSSPWACAAGAAALGVGGTALALRARRRRSERSVVDRLGGSAG